jgi:AraC-like DNA-binding protein
MRRIGSMLTRNAFIRLCRARDLLSEVRDRRLTIDEVAREAGMSPYHFIRQFAALFGQTPHQFRIQSRLDRAKRLLALDHESVTGVCLAVGFSSLGSFSDQFARRVGVPPSEYRRRVRTRVAVPGLLALPPLPGCLSVMAAAFATFEKRPRSDSARLIS